MHTAPALRAKQASSVYIMFSSNITAKSEEDNFNQKQTRHFFKVQIRVKFLARHSGDKKVVFQIFCLPEAKSSRHCYVNPCYFLGHLKLGGVGVRQLIRMGQFIERGACLCLTTEPFSFYYQE